MRQAQVTSAHTLWIKLWASLALAALGACTSASGPADTPVQKRFQAYLAECTAQYGYDPDATEGIGEREIAPNELAWRECAYRGVETILVPGSKVADSYRLLIDEDRAMTDAIIAGTMTRQERRDRIQQLFAEISNQEAQMATQEEERMRLVIEGLRR